MAQVATTAPPKPTTVSPPLSHEPPSGAGKWMALAAALLGWMFDGAEMGIFSMIGRQAVRDLLRTSDEAVVGLWFGIITAGLSGFR